MNLQFQNRCAAFLLGLCLACSPAPSAAPSAGSAGASAAKNAPPIADGASSRSAPQAQALDASGSSGGWNPSDACFYLEQVAGMRTGSYKQLEDDEYACFTPYKVLGDDGPGLANNIAYYVDGNSKRAVQLKLVLNVNDRANEKSALSEFRKSAEALTAKALGAPVPAEVARALSSGKAGTWAVHATRIEVRRDDWPTGKGYSVHYVLRRAD